MALGHKTGGRGRGTPNKTTTDMRDAIIEAFHEAGGVDYLVRVANAEPKTFLALLGRVLPKEIKAEVEQPTLLDMIVLSRELEQAG
ncbi:MAG: hypothetical protein ACI9EF_002669 [Pseudohongiellaceae bacterium]|jgi:hypothetical protein